VISGALLAGAFFGMLDGRYVGSNSSQPEYRARARQSVKRGMEFILCPVKHAEHLVPELVEQVPGLGGVCLFSARIVAFPPCFWMMVVFIGIRLNRQWKVVTTEKMAAQMAARYGHLLRPFSKRPNG
jgi:hypothetical protein